jgi:hypothetical protein
MENTWINTSIDGIQVNAMLSVLFIESFSCTKGWGTGGNTDACLKAVHSDTQKNKGLNRKSTINTPNTDIKNHPKKEN